MLAFTSDETPLPATPLNALVVTVPHAVFTVGVVTFAIHEAITGNRLDVLMCWTFQRVSCSALTHNHAVTFDWQRRRFITRPPPYFAVPPQSPLQRDRQQPFDATQPMLATDESDDEESSVSTDTRAPEAISPVLIA